MSTHATKGPETRREVLVLLATASFWADHDLSHIQDLHDVQTWRDMEEFFGCIND
jgi:hypothetical protein